MTADNIHYVKNVISVIIEDVMNIKGKYGPVGPFFLLKMNFEENS